MAKFCGKCGGPLDDNGKCCNCDKATENMSVSPPENNNQQKTNENSNKAVTPKKKLTKAEKKAHKKAKKKENLAKMTFGQKVKRFFIKLLAIILALSIVVGAGICVLVYFDKMDIPIIKSVFDEIGINEQEDSYDNLAHNLEELEEIDIGEEARKESQILETIEASTSAQVTSEADVAKQFKEKGFTDSVIYTSYSMDGSYNGDEKIDENSTNSHPLYYAIYISDAGYCWTIYSCNGEWSASPISYLYSGLAETEIMISEKNYIMSYDSYTNSFYKLIPNSSECVIKTVSVITSETLDSLAEKEFSIS